MTPIAHMLAKDSLLPVKQRRYGDAVEDLGIFNDLHFFEVSNIFEAAGPLAGTIVRKPHQTLMRYAFLPAPRSLLEFACQSKDTPRAAFLLEQDPTDKTSATARFIYLDASGTLEYTAKSLAFPLMGSVSPMGEYSVHLSAWKPNGADHRTTDSATGLIYALLAMINTPRVIGRRQHMPHRGLERSLLSAKGAVGKFPLQGWTELVLHVRPPDVVEKGEPTEAHFTGERALHFCRCHLRIRLGTLELVTAHWRGDPALGIKQTRYRLEMGRGRAAA